MGLKICRLVETDFLFFVERTGWEQGFCYQSLSLLPVEARVVRCSLLLMEPNGKRGGNGPHHRRESYKMNDSRIFFGAVRWGCFFGGKKEPLKISYAFQFRRTESNSKKRKEKREVEKCKTPHRTSGRTQVTVFWSHCGHNIT